MSLSKLRSLIPFMLFVSIQSFAFTLNSEVLRAIDSMPVGGGYSTTPQAATSLINAVHIGPKLFEISTDHATPSFCSMATYLVFLKVIENLKVQGMISASSVSDETLERLSPPITTDSLLSDDGVGAWGRWNANGPGTARFFFETHLGKNFTDFKNKKPGDFLKIFWTDAVGAHEHGHSVIYLGERKNPTTGDDEIQYWSSNQKNGYGKFWVSKSKIVHALFSRFDRQDSLNQLDEIPASDPYLRSLKTQDSTWSEALRQSGF